ncbi:MAG: precorrin-6y C5,15-methyltransferase (decarboxylating) subunit CbiE [Lachnospiraceae bacterium]|nr:precorrin-6y C5,15-methyltransferase (decarboxylating) subunit CbiE [Lachnospiraceae bacterium]
MGVILAGCGGGETEGMTVRVRNEIENADLVLGSERILNGIVGYIKSESAAVVTSEKQMELIRDTLKRDPDSKIVVLFSGDTGIFSGALKLEKSLKDAGFDYETIPGISSFALMANAMGRSYEDALFLSAHGREVDIMQHIKEGRDIYVLTDRKNTPNELCKLICEAGLSSLKACVGVNLSYVNHTVTYGTVSEISSKNFGEPAVLFLEGIKKYQRSVPGIPDEEFIRGDVPMTKHIIRASVLSFLDPGEKDVCWDLGAGTGSVSVELAMFAKTVYAVEKNPEAASLIKKNREKFGGWNIKVVEGDAKECTGELKMPDKVFIGGSGGHLKEIIGSVFEKNSRADIVMTAVTLDTLNLALRVFEEYKKEPQVIQIGVSETENAGKSRILKAQNPVFIISCKGDRP